MPTPIIIKPYDIIARLNFKKDMNQFGINISHIQRLNGKKVHLKLSNESRENLKNSTFYMKEDIEIGGYFSWPGYMFDFGPKQLEFDFNE